MLMLSPTPLLQKIYENWHDPLIDPVLTVRQQQNRELFLTVIVSAYFIGRVFMWINRSI